MAEEISDPVLPLWTPSESNVRTVARWLRVTQYNDDADDLETCHYWRHIESEIRHGRGGEILRKTADALMSAARCKERQLGTLEEAWDEACINRYMLLGAAHTLSLIVDLALTLHAQILILRSWVLAAGVSEIGSSRCADGSYKIICEAGATVLAALQTVNDHQFSEWVRCYEGGAPTDAVILDAEDWARSMF